MTDDQARRSSDGAPPDPPVRVVVVDDNPVVRLGISSILGFHPLVEVVGEASDGVEAVNVVRSLDPDVLLLDVQMPRRDGLSVAHELADEVAIIMTTFADTSEVVHAAVDAGAVGYLVHGTFEPQELVEAVLSAAAGIGVFGPSALASLRLHPGVQVTDRALLGLSKRQTEIMDLVAAGRPNRDIARALFLADKTVKNHVRHIFAQLGVRNRAQAVALWLAPGNRSV